MISKEGTDFDKNLLFEQYKLYVEMADNVSNRRTHVNVFYITVISSLFAVLSFTINKNISNNFQNVMLISIAILGLILCYVWYNNIRSYRQLNSGKFKVIHTMEQYLPFQCYKTEWKILGKGKDGNIYSQLTCIEQYVPAIIAILYLILLIFFIDNFLTNYYKYNQI